MSIICLNYCKLMFINERVKSILETCYLFEMTRCKTYLINLKQLDGIVLEALC